ncbi:SusC/RagA family TonB-linked outer membrane protein [Segatella cerevisiae]
MNQVKFTMSLRIFALLCGFILSANGFAQQIIVKGHIKDVSGEPIIGATIRFANGNSGTVSDLNGDFTLKANTSENLTITYVGYQKATVKAIPRLTVILKEDNKMLNDIVVIGYGTVKKSDATGSVVSVEADQLNKGLATSPADLLQGKATGVQIISNGGGPGAGSSIRIRGGSSLSASNDPLIVIDGLPISSTSISGQSDILSSINPNDIESFSILKDASATAIYGSRASNGVIVITTKRGTSGKPQVTVDLTSSFQKIAKKVDVMNANEFKEFFMDNYGSNENAVASLGNSRTNWQNEIYRTAWTEEINAGISGGYMTKNKAFSLPYRISTGFLNDDGIVKTTNMKRGTLSFNLTPTLLDNRLTINLNGNGVYSKNTFADDGVINAAVQYDPMKPVYDTSGILGYTAWQTSSRVSNTMSTLNPVAMLNAEDKTSNIRRFIGNTQFDYKFFYIPGLRANLNLGIDVSTSDGWNHWLKGSEVSFHDKVQNGAGLWEKYTQFRRDQTLEFYLDYAKDLKSIASHFDILGGYSWQHFYNKTTDIKKSADGTSDYASTPLTKTESYLISFYGRLNYSLMDRYLFTFTLRDDGTSRFQNNKWGLFPSLALAWRMSEEPFMKQINWLSNLKLRLGYGITGQQNIGQGDYPSIPTYHMNQGGSYYQFGDQVIIPITPKAYDADIKWESTTTYNLGLDFGFLNNRINGSIDAYQRKTKDLLNYVPIPAGTNLSNYLLMNIGNLKNTGLELTLNFVPIENRNWHWDIGFNVSYNKNKITKLTADDNPDYVGVLTGGISGGVGNNVQIYQVGQAAGSFYVYQQAYDSNHHPIEGTYVDRNGDGQINEKDKYVYKHPNADVFMGFNTEVRYNQWTLSASLRASLGNYVYDNVASNNEMKADMWTNNFIANRLKSAVNSNFSQAQYLSDYYVRNASFLKLDKITLGYNATKWLQLHLTVQNVFTITKYDGVDPELPITTDNKQGGIDNNMYPRPRTVLFGASFKF